tara:strand:- start:560 stop:700 length:141 start_codon:yes stop_codon:yes gene_type:complete
MGFDHFKTLAEQGDAEAQVNLGVYYFLGDGVLFYCLYYFKNWKSLL